jgi:ribosomal RNA assembly protein
MQRLKGRLIGREGKTREVFESMTGARISIYGKTISLIGYPEQNSVARTGIDMLLKGSSHGPVYNFLEKKKTDLKNVKMGF